MILHICDFAFVLLIVYIDSLSLPSKCHLMKDNLKIARNKFVLKTPEDAKYVECSSNPEFRTKELQVLASKLTSDIEALRISGYTNFLMEEFKHLKKLKYLSLSGSGISNTKVPKLLPSIVALDIIATHSIRSISNEDFIQDNSLNYFALLSSNLKETKGSAFKKLTKLEYLFLDSNGISIISDKTFIGLSSLKILSLDNNNIGFIFSFAFIELVTMEKLHLQNNMLKKISSNRFSDLPSLRFINLTNNLITTIKPLAFNGLYLETLYLQDNQIKNIDETMFVNSTIRKIYLEGNPLKCDCNLFYFLKRVRYVSGECDGKSITDFLSNNRLNCTACSRKPCDSFKSCHAIDESKYKCRCKDGYFGDKCSVKDECFTKPCMNNAICSNTDINIQNKKSKYKCRCKDGYFGDKCSVKDECFPKPCMNNAICSNTGAGKYNCICAAPYVGVNCSEITDLPFINTTYRCNCSNQDGGCHCTERIFINATDQCNCSNQDGGCHCAERIFINVTDQCNCSNQDGGCHCTERVKAAVLKPGYVALIAISVLIVIIVMVCVVLIIRKRNNIKQ